MAGYKITAARKAAIKRWQAAGAAKRKKAAGKTFSDEYRTGKFVGATKRSSRQWAAAAATFIDKKRGTSIALRMGRADAKRAGLSGKRALRHTAQYVRNVRSMAKDPSIKIKYGKRKI